MSAFMGLLVTAATWFCCGLFPPACSTTSQSLDGKEDSKVQSAFKGKTGHYSTPRQNSNPSASRNKGKGTSTRKAMKLCKTMNACSALPRTSTKKGHSTKKMGKSTSPPASIFQRLSNKTVTACTAVLQIPGRIVSTCSKSSLSMKSIPAGSNADPRTNIKTGVHDNKGSPNHQTGDDPTPAHNNRFKRILKLGEGMFGKVSEGYVREHHSESYHCAIKTAAPCKKEARAMVKKRCQEESAADRRVTAKARHQFMEEAMAFTEDYAQRLVSNEATALAENNHPNLIKAYHMLTNSMGTVVAFTMDLVSGGDVHELIGDFANARSDKPAIWKRALMPISSMLDPDCIS
ncbi:hypothetical protein WJX73_002098 [Symbiochloris irregularis]|uniref:Protein kinase domain-containing protein n=1 Tax=Symbiochloris irregularis TaxID=706552 RepID=A0AAW1PZJ1_9CHLO